MDDITDAEREQLDADMEGFWVNLAKWPGLHVEGDPVDPEQAREIILRTTIYEYLDTNPGTWQWTKEILESLGIDARWLTGPHATLWGIEPDEDDGVSSPEKIHRKMDLIDQWHDSLRNELGVLDLEYLSNSMLTSSYIGGAHGWMNWDGTIQPGGYGIGKWPSQTELLHELRTIAAAFPFLRMSWRFYSEDLDNRRLLCQFEMVEGGVVPVQPVPPTEIPRPRNSDLGNLLGLVLGRPSKTAAFEHLDALVATARRLRAERGFARSDDSL